MSVEKEGGQVNETKGVARAACGREEERRSRREEEKKRRKRRSDEKRRGRNWLTLWNGLGRYAASTSSTNAANADGAMRKVANKPRE